MGQVVSKKITLMDDLATPFLLVKKMVHREHDHPRTTAVAQVHRLAHRPLLFLSDVLHVLLLPRVQESCRIADLLLIYFSHDTDINFFPGWHDVAHDR